MVLYDGLRGHYSLKTASEVKYDIRFYISDLNYMYILLLCSTLMASRVGTASKTASEAKSDLRFEISDLKVTLLLKMTFHKEKMTNMAH